MHSASCSIPVTESPARALDWARLLGFVAATLGCAGMTVLILV